MTKYPIGNESLISITEKNYADVLAAYQLPLNDEDIKDFPFKDCIVVLFSLQQNYERKYLYCQYLEEFTFDMLMEIPQAKNNPGLYIAKHSHPRIAAEQIREKYSI